MLSRTRWTAADLLAADFPPPRWAVEGLIPEGLTLLCASPKFGKSWLALGLGVAIANGGYAFGRVPVTQGDAVVLALEDTAPRLQTRLQMLCGDTTPDRLHIWTTWDSAEELDAYLYQHPECRYVGVDVFQKVRGFALKGESIYNADYRALEPFKEIADRHRVAVVMLHHVRKAGSEDFLDSVSGTHGLAGSADTVIVMTRSRMTNNAVMKITSREFAEAERALNFDPTTGQWLLLDGPVLHHEVADTRRAILAALLDAEPMTPKELAAATSIGHDVIRQTVRRMAEDEQIIGVQGRYRHPDTPVPLSLASPESLSDTLPGLLSDSGDRSDTPTAVDLEESHR